MKAYHKLRAPQERRFSGQYAEDGKAKRFAVRAAAGHRCVRCQHPFKTGATPPQWSPCDSKCTHEGPIRFTSFSGEWIYCHGRPSFRIAEYIEFNPDEEVQAEWRVLTVHHLDGQKDNDAWWNTLALCQRCHLEIQGKVDPRIPWFLEHSEWFRIYAAGFYAKKYEGRDITREEAEARLDELLAYECKTV